jgi:hypothetical protein
VLWRVEDKTADSGKLIVDAMTSKLKRAQSANATGGSALVSCRDQEQSIYIAVCLEEEDAQRFTNTHRNRKNRFTDTRSTDSFIPAIP